MLMLQLELQEFCSKGMS